MPPPAGQPRLRGRVTSSAGSPSLVNASRSVPLIIGSSSAPAPPIRGARSRFLSILSGVVTIITGPESSVEKTRADGAIRSLRSKRTRVRGRRRCTSRAVSSGSSARTVPDPTAIASTSARTACACRSESSELIRVRSPVLPRCDCRARRRLHDDERPPLRFEREIRAVQLKRALATGANGHLNAFFTQKLEPAAAHARIGIDRRRDDARDAGCRHAPRTVRCGRRASTAPACNTTTRRGPSRRLRRVLAPRHAVLPRARDIPARRSCRLRARPPRQPLGSDSWCPAPLREVERTVHVSRSDSIRLPALGSGIWANTGR